MKYPMAATTLLYRRQADGRICVTEDVTKDSAFMTPRYARFLRSLDGKTDPYSIRTDLSREEIDAFLETMRGIGFIRQSRVFEKWIGTIIYTLWVPKPTRRMKRVAWVWDRLLRLLWIPVLVAGIYLIPKAIDDMDLTPFWLVGWIAGMLLGIVLHELSHGLTALANGAHFFEAGVLIRFFLPGAYAMIDEDSLKDRTARIRIDAAGVEMNFFLAGLGVLLAVAFRGCADFWFSLAVGNLLLALPNTLFFKGLDGYKILMLLIGKKDETLFPIFSRGQTRKNTKKKLTVFSMARLMLLLWQLSVPLMMISNVVVFFD